MKMNQFVVLCIVGAISGCTAINSTSFSDLSSAYREVVEEYSNNNILLNIVRTSKNMPMSFLDIPSVIGTGSVQATAGATTTKNVGVTNLPDSVYGGSVGLAVNNGFTFSQASLDNAQFMQSFLKPIPLDILKFKGTETLLPQIVSYTLLIESIELRSNNSLVKRLINDPLDPDYSDFQQFLTLLIESGLSVENMSRKTPLGPPLEKGQLNKSLDSWGASVVDGLAKGTLSLEKVVVNGKESYQLTRIESRTRICVNKFRAEQLMGNLLSSSTHCQDSPDWGLSNASYAGIIEKFLSTRPGTKNLEMAIITRSPGNVFNFLGSVLNAQFHDNGSKTVMIKPALSVIDDYNPRHQTPTPLFKVYKNTVNLNRAASVKYKGDTYAIADDDDSYSKEVLEFMSTLVSITKIPGAIPQTPAVIVR